MKRLIIPFGYLLLLCAPLHAYAWGPFTHQAFGCQLLDAWKPQCYSTATNRSFVLGAAAPDAFKKFLPGGTALHTFEFAGYQLLFALHHSRESTADFDAVAYSRGFGAHIAEDLAGHHHRAGYLTHLYDHPLETAVDTWYVTAFPQHGYIYQQFEAFSPAVVDFVTQAIADYTRAVPVADLTHLTPAVIQSAMRSFDTLASKEQAVIGMNALYKLEMVQLDNYRATDFTQALAHLQLAQQCALQAARYWQAQIEQPHANPEQVGTATRELIAAWFATKQCQPSASRPAAWLPGLRLQGHELCKRVMHFLKLHSPEVLLAALTPAVGYSSLLTYQTLQEEGWLASGAPGSPCYRQGEEVWTNMRVLLVEDDPMIGDSIQHGLRHDGFTVDWVQDGVAAELALRTTEYAVVLLDLGLPHKSGLEVLTALRRASNPIPVVILTARDAVADRVHGLDSGADDYLVKPFALDELTARMRAVLRRHSGRAEPVITHGDLTLDPATHQVTWCGAEVSLSSREFAILQALLEYPGRVLSRARLEERLYGWEEEVASNAIEVHIHHLRKKLGPELIRNVRGVGYMVPKNL